MTIDNLIKGSVNLSGRQITSMIEKKKMNFDHALQRGDVWDSHRRTALIESMLYDFPISSFYAKRKIDSSDNKNQNIYYILEGKQRLTTIGKYLSDEFKLSNLPDIEYFDQDTGEPKKINISGKRFSELPEFMQDTLNYYSCHIVYFDNLTAEQEMEIFVRLGSGKPLTSKNLLLAKLPNYATLHKITEIGNHEIFAKTMTKSAIDNKTHLATIIKMFSMLTNQIDQINFGKKSLFKAAENLDIEQGDASVKKRLIDVLDYFDKVHMVLEEDPETNGIFLQKKIYKETHFVSLVPFVDIAVRDKIKVDDFVNWLKEFYTFGADTSVSAEYNEVSQSGTGKNSAINTRHNELNKSFSEYFGKGG